MIHRVIFRMLKNAAKMLQNTLKCIRVLQIASGYSTALQSTSEDFNVEFCIMHTASEASFGVLLYIQRAKRVSEFRIPSSEFHYIDMQLGPEGLVEDASEANMYLVLPIRAENVS